MHRSADFPRLNARMNCSNCSMRSNCKGCMSKCFPVPLTKAQVKAILQRFDSDGDCRLSKKELESALYYIGSHLPGWRATQALNTADRNHDGYINDSEMDDLVEYVWQRGYTIS
ncbi:hypothetical protein V6N13_103478 [Hibiscus sabdariffa]|uniref:EF-hand domain-containing protein n=1 Tax=Hibiscus sabdariffa TaxID=183260 RepID=A0ABR2NH21_9ROSI